MKTLDKLKGIFNELISDASQKGEGWAMYGKGILTPEGKRIRNTNDAQRTLFYHYNALGYQ